MYMITNEKWEDKSELVNKHKFDYMYDLYKFILENNVGVESSKKYAPFELINRIFFYTITGEERFVPRPIRDKVRETYENEEKMIKKYNIEVWKRKEEEMDRIEAWVDKMHKSVGGIEFGCFFQYKNVHNLPPKHYKLHITAPPEKALEFVEYVSAVLEHLNVPFKVANRDFMYDELNKTNQRGKLITIYPPSEDPKSYITKLIGVALFFKDAFDGWKNYKSKNEQTNKEIEEKITNLFRRAPPIITDVKFGGENGNLVYYRVSDENDENDRDPKNKLKGKPPLEKYLSTNIHEIPKNIEKYYK